MKSSRAFLPTTRADLEARGWSELDVVIVSGDAYVDHPAFGPPLIARFLEGRGFKVGFIAQPDWRSVEDFRRLGRPRLFFGISAGNMDSMLNRLTAQKKNRGEDQYSPAGRLAASPSETVSDGRVLLLPSFAEVDADKRRYALASRMLHYETNPYNARPLVQRDSPMGAGVYFNPPALPLETADMDELYDL